MKKLVAILSTVLGFGWFASAQATDVPASLIVHAGGLEWAWASPCAPVDPSCGTPLIMHDGWSIATESDFLASFTGFVDLSAQFQAGTLCASAYFNSGFAHCDDSNVDPQFKNVRVWNAPAAWGANNMDGFSESFVVRVPEPGTVALLAIALLGAGVMRRRQRD